MIEYQFTMDLRVHDADTLLRHALDYAVKHDNMTLDDAMALLKPDGETDIGACLVIVLDPGHLPGVKIDSSDAESTSLTDES